MIKAGQQRCRERAHVTPAANAARLPGNGPRRASRAAALSARRAAVTLGLAGLLLGGATVASAPPAPAAFAAGHGTGWRIVPSPNGGRINNTLVQASAGPGTRAWAVGYDGAVGNLRTLIQRWSGTRWAVVASPSPSKLDNVLSGVATLSATSAWAVGYTSVSVPPRSYHRALIEHWNGRAWQVVPSPQAGTSDSDLWGVTALSATNAWAVGQPEHRRLPVPAPGGALDREHLAAGARAQPAT